MRQICYTSMRRAICFGLIALLMIAVAVGVFIWMLGIEPELYDPDRQLGIPEAIPAEKGYRFYRAQDICDVWICGNPAVDGKNVDLFLTNPESNEGLSIRVEVYTAARTIDEKGNATGTHPDQLLGKSGFIQTGEYVRSVKLNKALKEQTTVILKIGTYIEETGMSNGFFYITTVLSPNTEA